MNRTAYRSFARRSLMALAALSLLSAAGCAGTGGWDFAESPGVPAGVRTSAGETLNGTLLGLSDRSLVIDTEVERGENVEVVRRDDTDYVYVDGIVMGTAVEVRDFDIVTRRKVPVQRTEELVVRTRGYLGWGSAVAGVLGFFLVQLLEEN
mgnify:CR=1 FL=1